MIKTLKCCVRFDTVENLDAFKAWFESEYVGLYDTDTAVFHKSWLDTRLTVEADFTSVNEIDEDLNVTPNFPPVSVVKHRPGVLAVEIFDVLNGPKPTPTASWNLPA